MRKSNFLLQSILLVILSMLSATCGRTFRDGNNLMVNRETLDDYWIHDSVNISGDTLELVSSDAIMVSRFVVRNFTLSAEILTLSGAEGLLGFHVDRTGNPSTKGYSVIINNSDYRTGNPQKTGSLSLIRNNYVQTAEDHQWFRMKIEVKNNMISVIIDGKIISEYIQPEDPVRIPKLKGRVLSDGYIVIQKTSESGQIRMKNLVITNLGDDLEPAKDNEFINDSTGELLTQFNQLGFPIIDYHGHLKGGLTVEQVCKHGRIHGYNYGIAPNCGLDFPVTNDSALIAYYREMKSEPVFKAMQCEGREWITLFTPEKIAQFDYIFTDAMTWTDHKGRRLRLWIPEETFVDDDQQFMDMLVEKIEAVMTREPVDVFVNPTYLPGILAARYDELWTTERMDRVIKVLKDHDVAMEINSRFKIPSLAFIKRARAAGIKFTLGTNNAGKDDLGRLEYSLKMLNEAGITERDMFFPRPSGEKKVMKMGLPSKITG